MAIFAWRKSARARLSLCLIVAFFHAGGLVSNGPRAAAQQARAPGIPPFCPTVAVSCLRIVEAGTPVTYTATVLRGDDSVMPTFNWTVSAGTVTAGQGTREALVDTAGAGGQSATAQVDVGGYARECRVSATCTVDISEPKATAIKFSEYTLANLSANRPQLDGWVLEISRDPRAQGYLIAYGGRTSNPGDAQTAADNATDYTQSVLKMDPNRTLVAIGGYRERPTIELWIGPVDAPPPNPTPTVDPSQVRPASVRQAPNRRPARSTTRP